MVEGQCKQPTMEPFLSILEDALDQFAMMGAGAPRSPAFNQARFVWWNGSM